jgi:hypothetical protein
MITVEPKEFGTLVIKSITYPLSSNPNNKNKMSKNV